MKKKTSISVSPKLLKLIDSLPEKPPRSQIIEEALVLYFKSRRDRERDKRDLNILNSVTKNYATEATDVLEYQYDIDDEED